MKKVKLLHKIWCVGIQKRSHNTLAIEENKEGGTRSEGRKGNEKKEKKEREKKRKKKFGASSVVASHTDTDSSSHVL